MRVFAIADPHLSKASPKPMTVFGPQWAGHPELFFERWREVVGPDDLVLIPGDISWALKLEEALADLRDIAALPGKKVLLRGNHDYWWSSIGKLRAALPEGMYVIQNDAIRLGGVTIAGSRGWTCPGSYEFSETDQKIYLREVERLRLSLLDAAKKPAEYLIVMLHYPPTNARLEPSGFTELLQEVKPDVLVFGHVHSEDGPPAIPEFAATRVYFVAADALAFRPKLIHELV